MWNKNIKKTPFTFLPYECAAAEEYLEIMAEKGWLLQSIKGIFYKFKKIKPKKIKYSVDVLHKVSIFDHKDSDVALEYREYCKAAGWNYVCQIGKIQIFYTEEDKKIISIHTDEEEKFKLVFKASLYNMGSQFIITIMLIFNFYIQLFIADTGFALATNMGVLASVGTGSLILMNSIGFVSFLLWVTKVRANIKRNKGMNHSNYRQVKKKNILRFSFATTYLFILLKLLIFNNLDSKGFNITILTIMCIPIIIMIFVRKFINKKRYAKNINMGITIGSVIVSTYVVLTLIVSTVLIGSDSLQNEVPAQIVNLTSNDFGFVGDNSESPYMNYDKSIIAQRVHYSGGNNDNYLGYTIFQSDYALVIKFYGNRLLSRLTSYNIDLKEKSTNLPNNIAVYSDSVKRTFVLMSEDTVVEIRKDFINISDEEFLNKVYKKLF
jgi:hypothetical protein